ncbi:MAG: hypothetical protein WBB28_28230 [Crinalium sp.]
MRDLGLFPGCLGFGVSENTVIVRVSDWHDAWKLNQSYLKTLAGFASFMGLDQIKIVHNTPGKPSIPILASMADDSFLISQERQYQQLMNIISNITTYEESDQGGSMASISIEQVKEFIGQEDCDAELAQMAYSEKDYPVWIVDQASQEVLLANRVAIAANCKPPREILISDISVLWEEDALRSLTDLVTVDRQVTDHTNIGWRWKKEDDSSIWVRVKHEFNVDYHLVNF